jgi:hypothetical protein
MFFIDFQNFTNFRRKLADFWPKNRHFFADSAKISKNFEKKSLTKNVITPWEMLQLTKKWTKMYLRVLSTICWKQFFNIWLFSNFTVAEIR